MPRTLIACFSCGKYAKASETSCPSCGQTLRQTDGSVPRAAAAVLLGLATTALGCSSSVESQGGAMSTGDTSTTTESTSSQSTTSTVATHYGPAPTTGVTTGGGF